MKKKTKPTLTPRLGPATGLRPAGAHKDKRATRQQVKSQLRQEIE
jgi:hypothetical protein